MSLLHAAVGVFTISNPIGNLPIVLSFTNGNRRQDLAIARSAALIFCVALLLSTWIGNGLLEFFGISRGAFRIAGGVIVVSIGLLSGWQSHAAQLYNQGTDEALDCF